MTTQQFSHFVTFLINTFIVTNISGCSNQMTSQIQGVSVVRQVVLNDDRNLASCDHSWLVPNSPNGVLMSEFGKPISDVDGQNVLVKGQDQRVVVALNVPSSAQMSQVTKSLARLEEVYSQNKNIKHLVILIVNLGYD
jgi:hypothetical protein